MGSVMMKREKKQVDNTTYCCPNSSDYIDLNYLSSGNVTCQCKSANQKAAEYADETMGQGRSCNWGADCSAQDYRTTGDDFVFCCLGAGYPHTRITHFGNESVCRCQSGSFPLVDPGDYVLPTTNMARNSGEMCTYNHGCADFPSVQCRADTATFCCYGSRGIQTVNDHFLNVTRCTCTNDYVGAQCASDPYQVPNTTDVGSPVVAPGLRAYTVDRNGKYEPLHVDSNDFLTGHLQENESMHVYAHYEEDILCTAVYFPNETYFTEPSWRHLPSSSGWDLISYRLSDVNWNHTGPFSDPLTLLQRPSSDESVSSDEQHQRFSRIRQKRQNNGLKKKCSLRLVADYSFYSQYARSSASEAIKIMVLVHTEYSTGPSEGPFSYNYEVDHWNTSDKLVAFSHHRDIMQFCLAHLFTHTLFMNSPGTVGLAYLGNWYGVGGICSMRNGFRNYPRTGWTSSVYTGGHTIIGVQHQMITAHGTAN
ncbi:hypothetical protein C0Q70_00617 [Pomacea canaliculata]|uniref:Uncharacterized protein n=1 Tax=Pomacea canaliculata TaxID=400727 RepID=A0A2T7PX62_POMCA|nr:hypothetical protein C0Q70_00617 [Pomacea canaliculata]